MSDETKEGIRSISRFLEQMSEGRCHAELSAEMHRLIGVLTEQAEATSGKAKGKLTIELNFEIEKGGICAATYNVKTKEPVPPRCGSVFWLTKDGNLSVKNTKQLEFGTLREAPRPSTQEGPPKEAGTPAV